jgi:hypothetical protein
MAIKITKDKISYIDITILSPVQGSVAGYTSGGKDSPTAAPSQNIDRFSFASDANAAISKYLNPGVESQSGQSSFTDGYVSGGRTPAAPAGIATIQKFPFSLPVAAASSVGDLTGFGRSSTGHSSDVSGYISGGSKSTPSSQIEKFPFAADGNATAVGNLTSGSGSAGGQSSAYHGYTTGNYGNNVISKFPFAADGNATDVGDLTVGRYGATSTQSSTVSGYAVGGNAVTSYDKFPFASDTNATLVGYLSSQKIFAAGQSSITHGYISGGRAGPLTSIGINVIEKFPFAVDVNGNADVGDLTLARSNVAGHQV